jgi:hypothetical protein
MRKINQTVDAEPCDPSFGFSPVRAEPFDFAVLVRPERNAVESKENGYAQDKLHAVKSKHERAGLSTSVLRTYAQRERQ